MWCPNAGNGFFYRAHEKCYNKIKNKTAGMVMILSVKQDKQLTLEFAYSPFFEMLCSLHVLIIWSVWTGRQP